MERGEYSVLTARHVLSRALSLRSLSHAYIRSSFPLCPSISPSPTWMLEFEQGASICQHGRRKFQCKECNGSAICMHNRRKGQCTICMGSSICEHSRRRSRCTLCGGSGVCEHRRRRSECKECRGSEVCSHLRIRSHCSECMSVTSAPNASAGTAFPLVNRASPSPKIKVQRARIGGASAAASDGFGGREDGGEDGSGGSGKFVWHDKKRQRKCEEQDVGCLRVDGREIPMVGGTAFVAPPLLPGLKGCMDEVLWRR